MTKDEALKLALEALERCVATCFDPYAHEQVMGRPEHFVNQTITTIKEALAQPEQEPDGIALTNIPHPKGVPAPDDVNADALEMVELELPDEDEAVGWADGGVINWIAGKQFKHASYLYTTPPQRKPLTDEEITDAVREAGFDWHYGWTLDDEEPNRFTKFARAIEAAHGIKENT